jgi:DNA-directed RNA polymerase subunit RPC12/RpoP
MAFVTQDNRSGADPSEIKNKQRRRKVYQEQQAQKKKVRCQSCFSKELVVPRPSYAQHLTYLATFIAFNGVLVGIKPDGFDGAPGGG